MSCLDMNWGQIYYDSERIYVIAQVTLLYMTESGFKLRSV